MSTLLLVSSGIFVLGMLAIGIIYPISKKRYITKQEKEIEKENKELEAKELNQNPEVIAINAFIAEHPKFSALYLKNLINQYIGQIIIKKPSYRCSEEVCKKIATDNYLDILKNMRIKETHISLYKDKVLDVYAIFSNYQEEYKIEAKFIVTTIDMELQNYMIYKKTIESNNISNQ